MCDRNPELASANMLQNRSWNLRKNTHPTVKPCDLMQYLVRLVTPNGWTVLDPFNWSGSTWKAVMYENKDRNKNYKYIWIELTEEYLPIAKARIEYVINKGIEKEKSDPKQEEQTKQRKESALF
jgi:site-specific DNA-methyltransferase (adenine-specific)